MGILQDRVKELKGSKSKSDFEMQNSLYFFEKYSKSDKEVQSISVTDIQTGRFYFLQYLDDSNWMRYSPVFTIDFKKFENLIILRAINFNFIRIDERVSIFDPYITEKDMKDNRKLPVDFTTIYTKLLSYDYPYSIVNYNLSQIKFCHLINMDSVPKFLNSYHPKNKYDERKLYDIQQTKIKTKDKRHQEMLNANIKDFFDISNDISGNYDVLKKNIQRVQNSLSKYGRFS